jgi:hypothetical protein
MEKPTVLNLNTPTIRNQRTLIWLQKSIHDTAVDWSKWDAIVNSMEEYHYWSLHKTKIVGIIITEINDFDKLYTVSKNVPIILLSQSVLRMKSEDYWTDNFDNIICLDQMYDQYPFLSSTWDGSFVDAVLLFAVLSRYGRVVLDDITYKRDLGTYDLTVKRDIVPQKVWLITQFFKHPSKKRFSEIRECLTRNAACNYVDKIVLLNEREYDLKSLGIVSDKIMQITIGARLTYMDFLKFVTESVPLNVFVILANADIYMGDSLKELWKINMRDRMMALLRWNVTVGAKEESEIFGPRADSQDTWILLSDSVKSRSFNYATFRFELGQAGCDNSFAGYMLRSKFVLLNPAMDFKTYHLHNTNIRNYDPTDPIRAKLYVNIIPTYIIDTKQEQVPILPPPHHLSNSLVSFEIKSTSLSNEITYCTMVEKDGRFKWEPSVENHYFDAAIPVYSWNNASVTSNGLVYDLYHIYTGKHVLNDNYKYWLNSKVDIYTPLQKQAQMIAVPFSDCGVFHSPDRYVLEYVSRCSRLRRIYPHASYWYPFKYQNYFVDLKWTLDCGKGVPFYEESGCWADEVVGYLPGPLELGQEDIAELRSRLSVYTENSIKNKLCIVCDPDVFTIEFACEIHTKLFSEYELYTVLVTDIGVYNAIIGASLCIFLGGKNVETRWAKLWALPLKCNVIEFQQELQLDGEFQHLAHVSGYIPYLLMLSKGSVEDVWDQVTISLRKCLQKYFS